MSYTKATNFAVKDTLDTGNPAKVVRGTEIDNEFNALQTATALYAPKANPTFTGTVTGATASYTGDLAIADKIVHIGDTDTAIRFPAVDTFTVETAGAEAFRITDEGLVGIGTTAPGQLLHIKGENAALVLQPNVDTEESRINFTNVAGIMQGRVSYNFNTGSLALFSNNLERMNITSAGHLNALYNLNVTGTTTLTGALVANDDVTVALDLTVSGLATIASSLNVGTTLVVSGDGNFGGDLTFTKAGAVNVGTNSANDVVLRTAVVEKVRVIHSTGVFRLAPVGTDQGLQIGYSLARSSANETFRIGATNSATPDLLFRNVSGTERMRLSTAGVLTVNSNRVWDLGLTLQEALTGTAINWSTGIKKQLTRSANATLTFTAPLNAGQNLTLKLILSAGAAITWPAGIVKWAGGTAPTFGDGTHIVGLYYDGTNYWAGASVNLS